MSEMDEPNGNDDSSQSASMGRTDEEEEEIIPMKMPAADDGVDAAAAEADESFLDDDFLSFDNVNNGGDGPIQISGSNGKLSGHKRERSLSPAPQRQNNGHAYQYNNGERIIPWLNETTNPRQPPQQPQNQYQQQQQQWGRNRGYGNNHNNYNQPPPPRTPPIIRLHNEIVSFAKLMEPTPEEMELRTQMVERITKLANETFGKDKCQVLPFGSQETGLCLPGSDIDFVIRFPKIEGKSEEGADQEGDDYKTTGSNPLHAFASAVKDEFGVRGELDHDEAHTGDNGSEGGNEDDDSEHLSYLEVIEQTRVPLVKFTVAPYNIDIDVCFDQPNGPESAVLMHRFMESMPPLRPLTFVLKYFLASRDINKPFTGGIGSYLLQLMIVSYLQHRSREDMARGHKEPGEYFNLGSLLLDFLELYGVDFNYVTTGISVRHDGYYFAKGQPDMKNVFYQPSRSFALAMENPLDPTMDVGGGAFRMQMIQRIFSHAFKVLLAYVSEPYEPTDSILAKIIPPTDEMEQRMLLKKDTSPHEPEGKGFASGDNGAKQNNGGMSKNQEYKGKNARKREKRRHKEEKKQARAEKRQAKQARRDEKKQGKRRHSDGGGGSKNKRKKENKRYSK